MISNRWNSAITEYALSCARAFELLGYKSIFTSLKGSPAEKRAIGYNLHTQSLESFSIQNLFAFKKIYKKNMPQKIITYGGPETTLAMLTPLGKTSVTRFRGYHVDKKIIRHKLSHGFIENFLSPAEIITEPLSKITSKKVHTIPIGIDTNKFYRSSINKKLVQPELLIFGRFDPVKGHREFLEVFKHLIDHWDESDILKPKLRIVGNPANLSVCDLNETIQKYNLTSHVEVTDERVENVSELLSNVTLGVVSSLDSEVICRVAEEFLLCGTPIVVSGAGALEEVYIEDSTWSYKGKTVPQVSDLLKQSIVKVFNESEEVKMNRSIKAKSLYSLEAMAASLSKY